MSSRNAYLTPEQRAAALVLSRALAAASEAVCSGERSARAVVDSVRALVEQEPLVALEYVELRDAGTLAPSERIDGEVLLALAARVGETRLIDNVSLSVCGDHAHADLGVRERSSAPCSAR